MTLHHLHTGESLKTVYFADGRYQPEALRAATHHLRDWRDNTTRPIDPKLLDLLWSLRRSLDTSDPIQVFCGYRSPGPTPCCGAGTTARRGTACTCRPWRSTCRSPADSLRSVRSAAMALKAGGVGYYPRSGFVHVDTGDIRYW